MTSAFRRGAKCEITERNAGELSKMCECWEKATRSVLQKKLVSKISPYIQENTCVGVSFWWSLIKMQVWRPATLLKRDSSTDVNIANFLRHIFWRRSANSCFWVLVGLIISPKTLLNVYLRVILLKLLQLVSNATTTPNHFKSKSKSKITNFSQFF